MHRRFTLVLRCCLLFLALIGTVLQPQSSAYALTTLTVTPLTWNVIGLDSNDVNVGPNHFPVGARVCNSGSEAATNVTATFVWDSTDSFIDLRSGTLTSINLGTLNAGSCADAYFEVAVTRNASAYDHKRRYHIAVTAGNVTGTINTPTPRELYVEHLISQSRNAVTDMQLNGVSVAAGGTMTLMVGQTYTITLVGFTATQGYEQIEYFVNFPNTIFQILSVSSTFTADTSATVGPSPMDRLYGDNCVWDNDPNSPTYRACLSTGKTGGNISTTYQVRILQVPGAPLVNPQPLSTLIYDFSGSSFHYNSDYGVSTRYANIVNASITKSFSPKTILPNGTSTLTFTITNPGPSAISNVNFTDDLPANTSLANTTVNYTGCGASPSPATVSDPLSFSNITVAANGTCTIAVSVTSATAGTYTNTTGNLFLGTTNTGSTGSDILIVSSQPPAPNTCSSPVTLASWTMPLSPAQGSGGPPPPYTTKASDVSTATATATLTGAGSQSIGAVTGTTTNAWGITDAWPSTAGAPGATSAPYFSFEVDSSNYGAVRITFDRDLEAPGDWGNATNNVYIYSSANGGAFSSATTIPTTKGSWQTGATATAATTGTNTTRFTIHADTRNDAKATSTVYLDNIVISGCPRPLVPTLSKSFSPTSIGRGNASTLTFTFTNPNSTALSEISFSDTLPTGLAVNTPNGLSPISCSAGSVVTTPAITATAGTSVISMSGLQLSGNASCSFSVSVRGNTAGSYTNVSGSITSTDSGPNTTATGSGTSSLTVVASPVIAKSFSANPIFTGNTTSLDFDITNPNASTGLTGVAFTDVLPLGLSVADGTFSVCGGTNNLTTTAATRTIALLNTTTIVAGGTCSFSVTVTGTTTGTYTNTTGNVTSTNGGTGNTATANVLVKTPSPAINLSKQVGPTATGPWTSFLNRTVGSNVYYRFTVENTGDVSLSNVSVSDPTVSTASCSWTRGDGATPVTSPFTLPVADAANNHIATCVLGPITAVSGLHTNTATASGTSGSTVTKTSSAIYGTPAITLVKSVTETSFNAAGDLLHYSYLVTNSGGAPLLGPITVADDKATVTCPAVSTVGDGDDWLEPANYPAAGSAAESLTCTATYTVTATDASNGFVTNTASATISGVTSNTDSRTVNGTTNLAITKNDGIASVVSGGTTTYTIRVTNNGPSSVTGAILSDPVVVGLTKTAVACSAAPGQCTVGTTPSVAQLESGTFALPTLTSGQFYEITVATTVTAANGNVTNTATVAPPAGGTDPDLTNNTASDTNTVTPAPDLTVSKTNNATNGFVASGGSFQWTLTVRNGASAGPASFANGDVILSDTVPAGQTYGAVTRTNGTPAPTGTIDCSITGTSLSCVANGVVTLPADASFTASFNVTTSGSANLPNTATVDPGGKVTESNETNNTGSNTVYVFDGQPSKLLVSTSEPSTSASRVTIGEMVRYRIAARIPESDFANFQLVDNIPSGMQYVNDGTARFAFVSNGAGVTSSTLSCANDSGNAFDLVSIPSASVDCALTGAISGGTGNGVAVTFSLGNLSNADVDSDAEYAIVEFNALVLNVTSAVSTTINQGTNNQTGSNIANNRQNDVTLRVNNTTVGNNSANVTVNIAEPAITNVAKSVSAGSYLPGDTVTYTLTFNGVASGNTNAATAFDILLTDTLNANLTPGAVNVSSTQAGTCQGGTIFSTSNSTSGQDVTVNISCLDPDQLVTVTIDATINAGTAGGTNISNTGTVRYSSLPGAQGSCSTSPFTCAGLGASGTATGERTGADGAGADTTVLNNYSDSGTASFVVDTLDIPPVAAPDTNTAVENGPAVNGDILTNETSLGNTPTTVTASDQGGTTITLGSAFTTAAGGSLTLNANGTYTYAPPASLVEGSVLTEVFNYTITDVDGDTSSSTLTITVDRLPLAVPDTNTATEGGVAATGNVITNDDEGNTNATVTAANQGGTAITVGSAFTTAAGGSLTLNADGTYSYTPPASLAEGTVLTEVFNYTITDADGDTSSSTLTITVDRLPLAVADTANATEGGSAATGNVIANDDEGNTSATVTAANQGATAITIGSAFTTAAGGTLTLNANGTYSYTPPATLPEGGALTEVFNYTITDADGDTSSTTLTITVDRLPQAVADTNTATEGGANATGNIITNDDEGNTNATISAANQGGTAITIGSAFTTAAGGTLTLNANGTYTYTPPATLPEGGVLTEVFSYTLRDKDNDISVSTLTITVDRLPQAVPDTNTATEGGPNATGNVITNDDEGNTSATVTTVVDDNGDPLTIGVPFNTDGGGTLTLNSNGSYTYTPPAFGSVPPGGFSEVFTYTITDADGDTSTSTLTITVNDNDRLPDAVADTNTATEGGSNATGNLLTNENSLGDTPTPVTAVVDDDGNPLTIGTPFATDGGGSLTVNADGTYTYTPPASLPEGGVLTEVFTYTITDVDGDTDTATLTITVDRLPQANPDTNTATEGGADATGNVITNDDEGNTSATVTAADQGGSAITIGTPFNTTAGGTLTLNGDGSYTYTPPATLPEGAVLTEVFNYTITDTDGDTSSTTLTITVDRLPQANPDTDTATEGGANATGNVITNDDEGNVNASVTAANQGGSTITVGSPFTTAAGGSLTLNADGSYTYTPPAINLVPPGGVTEVFNYTITDNDGDTSSSTLTITVADDDQIPVAVANSNTATENGPAVNGNMLTDDSLGDTPTTVTSVVDDDGNPLTPGTPFATDGGGSLTINADGTYSYAPPAWDLVPPAGLVEVFTYTITDVDGDTDTTTLTITVNDDDRLPVATDNSYTIDEGSTASGNVMTDGTPDTLGDPPTTVTAFDSTSANGGTVTVAANGSFTYDPNGFVGTDTFTYTITDKDGDVSTATVTITITNLPDAINDSDTTDEGTPVTTNVLTNDDQGTAPATITSNTQGTNGSVTCTATTCTYTPGAGFTGTDTYTYTIRDVNGNTDTATVTITILNLPDAVNDSDTTAVNTPVTTSVLTNDDLGTTPTTITSKTNGTNGSVTCTLIDCTYTPNPGFAGTDSYTYTITDANVNSDTATVTITIDLSRIGIAKRIVSSTQVSSGTYDVTYDLYVENFGTTALNNIQVTDNLSTTFAAPTTFSVQSLTSADFTVNAGYDGSSNTNLLAGTGSLAANANGSITLIVRVIPAGAGPFNNTAIVSGRCPTCTTPVTDQSQDGADPDPDNDGDPTDDNDPTPLTFGPNLFDPPFGLKVVDPSGIPVLRWTMVWINDSNIVAINAQVSDSIPVGTSFVAGSLTCTPSGVSTTSTCFYELPSLTYPRGRVIWTGNLGPDLGATDAASAANEVTITFNVNVAAGITSVQNTATVDYDGNGDGDLLDAGEQLVATASATWSAASSSNSRGTTLPDTGFAPDVVTDLSNVPFQSYTATGDVTMEIPGINIKLPVVGVPKKDGTWNVSWLGNQAGWLEGTAFPSWSGNSVLTSHVYLSNGLPGPFANLGKLKYGDKIVIHAYGQKYTFEVRENKIVEPTDQSVLKHEEKSWLTLITCKEYDPLTNSYRKRVVVRAVLVNVTQE